MRGMVARSAGGTVITLVMCAGGITGASCPHFPRKIRARNGAAHLFSLCHPDGLRFLQAGGPMQPPAARALLAELHGCSGAKKRRHQDDKMELRILTQRLTIAI